MLNKSFVYMLVFSWGGGLSLVQAEEVHLVDHVDIIVIDSQLSLAGLVNETIEKYPDYALINAMKQEADTLKTRGNRWLAGAATASVYYRDDFIGGDTGAYELEGSVNVPIWNWGQRDAGQRLAEQSGLRVDKQDKAIRLKVAGLVRESLWILKLDTFRHKMAKKSFHLTEKLLKTVQLRVSVGDLPRSDFLLAESELLQKKIQLIQAEAELMHARKRFFFLTQGSRMPAKIEELQSELNEINESHPALAANNALVAKQKANVEWIKAKGSGQTRLGIGGNTDKPSRTEESIDSITFSISMPFGGQSYAAPEIAKAQTEYIAAETEKRHVYLYLLEQIHEAEHELEIERVQVKITAQMKANAEEHLKMADLSFVEGEIDLMNFLKIQARSQKAIKSAKESEIRLQRDIALYNQAVGVTP